MIPATVQLTQLNRRINNGGQEDGSVSAYLWVIMFALDGTNITQNGLSLSGAPQWFFGAGSDGNLNQDISQGQGIPIPPSVGTWFLNLSPIIITDPTMSPPTTSVPATIGVVAVLMDAGATPTEDMEAGHQALNNFVQTEINNFVSGINLLTVSQSAAVLVMQGQSAAAATVATIQTLLAPVIATIQGGASSVVYNAVVNALGLGGEILSGIDPDTQIGSQNLTIAQAQLMNLDPAGEESYTAYQFQMVFPTSNDTYYLFGFAQNLNQVVGITPGVPPGNWQVTGVNKGFSNSLRSSYIREIGGQRGDGSQWYLERSAAVKLIQDGVNTFYVVGADGSRADVIVSDKPVDGNAVETYLTTTPDRSVEDNLDSLPPFSLTKLVPGPPTP
jgi:hypothetical protein